MPRTLPTDARDASVPARIDHGCAVGSGARQWQLRAGRTRRRARVRRAGRRDSAVSPTPTSPRSSSRTTPTSTPGTRAPAQFLPAFPRLLDDLVFFGSAAIADVSGDGQAELLAGSGGYLVHAMDATTGAEAPGWPKFTGGWIIATPAVGPLRTRARSVAVTTREGDLWVWRGHGKRRSTPPWPRYHHDARNSGYLAR